MEAHGRKRQREAELMLRSCDGTVMPISHQAARRSGFLKGYLEICDNLEIIPIDIDKTPLKFIVDLLETEEMTSARFGPLEPVRTGPCSVHGSSVRARTRSHGHMTHSLAYARRNARARARTHARATISPRMHPPSHRTHPAPPHPCTHAPTACTHASHAPHRSAMQCIAAQRSVRLQHELFAVSRAAKFLDAELVSINLALELSARLNRCRTPQQVRDTFRIAADFSSEEEAAALAEPLFTPPNATARSQIQRSLSAELGDEDAITDMLRQLDLHTLQRLRGVSREWRQRVRVAITDPFSKWRQRSLSCRGEFGARLALAYEHWPGGKWYVGHDANSRTPASFARHLTRVGILPEATDAEKNRLTRTLGEWLDLFEGGFTEEGHRVWVDCNVLSCGPQTSLWHWHAIICGPVGTPYEGGCFELQIHFPEGYPFRPPEVKFLTPIHHPNIDKTSGEIKVDILRRHEWSPALCSDRVIVSLVSLLSEPNFEEVLMPELQQQHRDDPQKYEEEVALVCASAD